MAFAQTASEGVAHYTFEPAAPGDRFATVPDATVAGHFKPWFSLTSDYTYRPHEVFSDRDEGSGIFGAAQYYGHLGAAVALWDRALVDLNLPGRFSSTDALAGSGGFALADTRLGVRGNLVGAADEAWALGIGLHSWIPTGSQAKATSDGTMRLGVKGIVSGSLGGIEYAGNLGFLGRKRANVANLTVGPAVTFGAAAAFSLADGMVQLGPEIFGHVVVPSSELDTSISRSVPLEALVTGRANIGDFILGATLGTALTPTPGTARFRFGLSVAVVADALFGLRDTDGDGIRDPQDACIRVPGVPAMDPTIHGCPADGDRDGIWDRDDACVTVPGVRSNDPKRKGCPPDRDDDGIVDGEDACPDVRGVKSDDPKLNGCPPDRDNDGIVDSEDACPDVPGVRSDDPKLNGCPPDRDNDGVFDPEDACVDVPGVRSDDPKRNGCPPDRDGDGVLDAEDACVDVPGPANPDPKKNGCPMAALVADEIRITEQVHFETGLARIKPESNTLLEAVAKVLREHPEIELVSIEGHTDTRGWPALNKKLSNDRAASVRTWLTTQGAIEVERLVSAGFGQDRPIADNATAEGREKNRRVEFHIKKRRDEAPKNH